MSFYLSLYIITFIFSSYVWYAFYKRYKNLSWISFLFFNIFVSIWFILYVLTYYPFYSIDTSLYITRLSYGVSVIGFLFLFLFVKYFWFNISLKNYLWKKIPYILFWSFLFLLIVFSDLFILWLENNTNIYWYYEIKWILFYFYYIVYFYLIFSLSYFWFKTYKRLSILNKIRYKNILFSWLFLLIIGVIFQLILPYFGYYFLEKELILLYFPFLIFSLYSITRYHYNDFSFNYREFYWFLLSMFFTFLFVFLLKKLPYLIWDNFFKYLWLANIFSYIYIFFSLIFFYLLYLIFISFLPGNNSYKSFQNNISKSQNEIRFILDIDTLNNYLSNKAFKSYWIKYINIKTEFTKEIDIFLKNFFIKNPLNSFFINDIVFLEENKNKFDININRVNIEDKIYIIFPIKNNLWKLIGLFYLWKKPYMEQYYSQELSIIKNFVNFLWWHLKYIQIYSKINYLSLNLDKEIDKKTIKYNNLINKQKEFISVASHEIKTPIMSSSFHIDSLIDDISDNKVTINDIKEELLILKNNLYNLSDLTKVLFDIQRSDFWKINLYIEKIKLENIFIHQINLSKKMFPNLDIIFYYDKKIWYIDIDKVQFTQVISNIISNAIKFSDKNRPTISISVKSLYENIIIIVEDNWKWFKDYDKDIIFEKYSTWIWKSIWLWLGLYLCKKITELHFWSIYADNSDKLWWALFKIIIPQKQ